MEAFLISDPTASTPPWGDDGVDMDTRWGTQDPIPPPTTPPTPLQGAKMFRGCRCRGLHLGAPHGPRLIPGVVAIRRVLFSHTYIHKQEVKDTQTGATSGGRRCHKLSSGSNHRTGDISRARMRR